MWTSHDRTYDHTDTESEDTVILSEDVGPYPAGTNLHDVLIGMAARLRGVEDSYVHGFTRFSLDALVVPYTTGTISVDTRLAFAALNAIFVDASTWTADLDAVIAAPVLATRSGSLQLTAFVVDPPGDAVTVLAGDIDATQTTVTVDNADAFPTSGSYLIQIGNEVLTVIGGQGTTTWTVVRGAGATSHAAGSLVYTC